MRRILARAFGDAPVDPASLAAFRIMFGAVMAWEVVRFAQSDWIPRHYQDPVFQFTYWGFQWVKPWPGRGMELHGLVLGILSLMIMVGWRYRVAAWGFFFSFSYFFLVEKARYLNHFYLIILVALVMALVPANRAFALDARGRPPRSIPAWALNLPRTLLGLVYCFAGVAKLNGDWLRAQPLKMWLVDRVGEAPEPLSTLYVQAFTPWMFSYGGMALDLFGWPLLLWRRTRLVTFCLFVVFHLTNAYTFGIGVFPWMAMAMTTLFFAPDWPRKAFELRPWPANAEVPARPRWVTPFLVVFLGIQVLAPLRHLAYPGNVNWNEEGHRFSWRMKLRTKHSTGSFLVRDPTSGESWLVDPRDELTDWQAAKMWDRPDMVLEYAHRVKERLAARGHPDVEVRARIHTSLNGRSPQLLIDPEVDLTQERRGLHRYQWVLPLTTPRPE